MGDCTDDENAAFWLPSHFLTDDDFVYTHRKPTQANPGFGSDPFMDSPLSSPGYLVKDNDSEYINELTRYLARSSLHNTHNNQKVRMISTSPQSTLSGFGLSGLSGYGSPNGPSRVPSPPLTPELNNDAAWDLLYEAAGQVARMKIEAITARLNANAQQNLLNAPRQLTSKPHPHHIYYNINQWAQENQPIRHHQLVREKTCHCQHHNHRQHHHHPQQHMSDVGTFVPLSPWPALSFHRQGHNHCETQHQMQRMPYASGTRGNVGSTYGVKRQSAGTGVFLPRRATTLPRHQYQPEPSRKPSDLCVMAAKRNTVVAQRRGNNLRSNEKGTGTATVVGPGHEIRLPSDWTY